MQININTEDGGAFEDEIAQRVAAQLWKHVQGLVASNASTEVHGLDVHALYDVATIAERWKVSDTTVRRAIQNGDLQQADWHGTGIRVRGLAILRYEGVPVDNAPSAPSGDSAAHTPPDPPTPSGDNARPYRDDLPSL